MASRAKATDQTPETRGSSGASASQKAELKPFSITHIHRNQPGRVQIDVIAATDEANAMDRAKTRFCDSTIVRVCRAPRTGAIAETGAAEAGAAEAGDPPNARFIRGEFREAETSDEPALRDLCK